MAVPQEYVHSEHENGILFREKKIFSNIFEHLDYSGIRMALNFQRRKKQGQSNHFIVVTNRKTNDV